MSDSNRAGLKKKSILSKSIVGSRREGSIAISSTFCGRELKKEFALRFLVDIRLIEIAAL